MPTWSKPPGDSQPWLDAGSKRPNRLTEAAPMTYWSSGRLFAFSFRIDDRSQERTSSRGNTECPLGVTRVSLFAYVRYPWRTGTAVMTSPCRMTPPVHVDRRRFMSASSAPGRVGAVLAAALRAAGHHIVGVSARSKQSRSRARRAAAWRARCSTPHDVAAAGSSLVVLALTRRRACVIRRVQLLTWSPTGAVACRPGRGPHVRTPWAWRCSTWWPAGRRHHHGGAPGADLRWHGC